MKYIELTEKQLKFLKNKINVERKNIEIELNDLHDIYYALVCDKTIEDLVPTPKKDDVTDNKEDKDPNLHIIKSG
jgi:hypothetical protein|tara:strand:- start:157 stop:381 length:225 start_codon:yes stop_codon:yes gene_type:complete